MSRLLPRLALALAVAAPAGAADGDFAYDVALRDARLYLGDARPLKTGDLALHGDRIAAVGEAPGRARREIDAEGLVVAPGFIDLHNHTDELYRQVGRLPLPGSVHANRNYLTQGVTTIVTGNCGSGFASPEAVAGWLTRVDALPFGSNVVHLVPHGQLRLDVMGGAQALRADPAPTPAEQAELRRRLAQGLVAGAWGLATGLEYDPGARADTDELVALASVAAEHGGIYASHTRHEGPDPERMLASYAEAIAIGERSGAPAHISHIKLSGRAVHGRTDAVIALVEAARARGVAVTADQYPYPAGSTGLSSLAPVEMRDGMTVLDRYCEGPGRESLRAAITREFETHYGPEDVLVSVYPWRWWLQGRRIDAIAAERGDDPVEVAADLACGWWGSAIYFAQDEADVRAFMQEPWVATASDGLALHPLLGGYAHPRMYGTFPRKLHRYAYEASVVTVPHALRSMTDLPAEVLGLAGRGRLAVGFAADVVVFDPARLRDVATFEESGRESEGVTHLFVNGVPAIDGGEVTGRRAGRALRLGADGGRGGAAS